MTFAAVLLMTLAPSSGFTAFDNELAGVQLIGMGESEGFILPMRNGERPKWANEERADALSEGVSHPGTGRGFRCAGLLRAGDRGRTKR